MRPKRSKRTWRTRPRVFVHAIEQADEVFPIAYEACRQHGDRADAPCPGCGFLRVELPAWCVYRAVFALDGKLWRVVSIGSTNRSTHGNMHFQPIASAEEVSGEAWPGLPAAPATKADVGASMRQLFALPSFSSQQLQRAIRRCSSGDG